MLDTFAETMGELGIEREEQPDLVRRLFSRRCTFGLSVMTDPLELPKAGRRPRQTFDLEETGFNEVPKRFRRFTGAGVDLWTSSRTKCALPSSQGGHPVDERTSRRRPCLLHTVHVAAGARGRRRDVDRQGYLLNEIKDEVARVRMQSASRQSR